MTSNNSRLSKISRYTWAHVGQDGSVSVAWYNYIVDKLTKAKLLSVRIKL